MTFKNIRIKMKGGKSRMQRVKVLASGKYKFVKNLGKKVTKSKGSNPSPKKARKVRRRMAKKKRRITSMTIPLAPLAGLAAGMARPAQELMAGNIDGAVTHLLFNYTGMSGYPGPLTFKMEGLKNGVLPLIVGLLVHKFVGGAPLNVNRILGAAKVPLIRI